MTDPAVATSRHDASNAHAPTVLITGASSGFGLLSAVEFARAGYRVFASMRTPAKRDALDRAATTAAVELEVVQLDVTDPASIDRAVAYVLEQAGAIDVLVNNAGYGIGGFFEDLTVQEIRTQFETNFFGVVNTTHAVAGHMRERGRGRIINVSSIAGRFGQPAMTAYCSSKFAVEGLSESLRYELLPFGVYVTLIEPGSHPTPIFEANRQVAARAQDPTSPYHASSIRLEALVDRGLEKSKADPRDVARVIVRVAGLRRPRLRYLVGTDARGLAAVRAALPSRALERLVLRVSGHAGAVGRRSRLRT